MKAATSETCWLFISNFGIDDRLRIGALVGAAGKMPLADAYDRLARDRAVATIGAAHRGIAAKVVALHETENAPDAALDGFMAANQNVARASEHLGLLAGSAPSIARLTVAAGLLDDLAR